MRGSFPFFPRSILLAGILVCSGLLPFDSSACLDLPNPNEFRVDLPDESRLLPNGMMALVYSDQLGEHRIHVSIHRVVAMLPGRHSSLPELRDPQIRIMESDGTIGPVTYLIKKHALYYGEGTDSLGFPKKSWIDPKEDGLNGNEHVAHMSG